MARSNEDNQTDEILWARHIRYTAKCTKDDITYALFSLFRHVFTVTTAKSYRKMRSPVPGNSSLPHTTQSLELKLLGNFELQLCQCSFFSWQIERFHMPVERFRSANIIEYFTLATVYSLNQTIMLFHKLGLRRNFKRENKCMYYDKKRRKKE